MITWPELAHPADWFTPASCTSFGRDMSARIVSTLLILPLAADAGGFGAGAGAGVGAGLAAGAAVRVAVGVVVGVVVGVDVAGVAPSGTLLGATMLRRVRFSSSASTSSAVVAVPDVETPALPPSAFDSSMFADATDSAWFGSGSELAVLVELPEDDEASGSRPQAPSHVASASAIIVFALWGFGKRCCIRILSI
ncbi:MAG: hypothetical protein AB7P21_31295 [Lautropia sp.]